MKQQLKIGAINWDAALPEDTYFGGYAIRSLGAEEYAAQLPYFTQKMESGYAFPVRSQADYDRELQLAAEGGLDFFAYCWYPEGKDARSIGQRNERLAFLEPHLHELNTARRLYQSSPMNQKIGMCAILFSIRAYSDSELEELCDAMRQDYYVTVEGRPLLILYLGHQPAFTAQVKAFFAQRGLNPYIAFINSGAAKAGEDYSICEAVTAYTSYHEAKTFDELTQKTYADNVERLGYGRKVIPMLSLGWNPMPRVDRPCPWVEYERTDYAGQPDEEELYRAFESLYTFLKENPEQADTGIVLTFAWNEFEEGGYLCPTLRADGPCDDHLLRAFAAIKKHFAAGAGKAEESRR